MLNCGVSVLLRRLQSHSLRISSVRKITYYEVLSISPSSTEAQVKDAFLELSKKYHPDTNAAKGLDTHDHFVAINEAYHVLSQSDLRKQYDEDLTGHESLFERNAQSQENGSINPSRSPGYKNPYHQYDGARKTAERWSDYYTPYAYSRARRYMERDIDSEFWKEHWEHNAAHGGSGPQIASHDPNGVQGKLSWKTHGRKLMFFCSFIFTLITVFVMYILVYDGKIDLERFHRDIVAATIRKMY